MERKIVKLREITTLITKGTTPSFVGCDFAETGVHFMKAESVTPAGRIDESLFAYISEETHDKLRRSQLQAGDILFSIAGMRLGKSAVVRERHLPANTNQALALIRPKRDLVAPEYLHYWFFNPSHYRLVNSITAQSAQPNINLTQVGELAIWLPPLATQHRIASILSAYDDLIENCERRIQVLETMAGALYREWFVFFRYPGHEKTPMVDSPRGPIPKGWSVMRLVDLLHSHIGGGWGKERADDEHPEAAWVIRGTDIKEARHGDVSPIPLRYHATINIQSRMLEPLDIVFEVSGGSKGQPVGRALLMTEGLLGSFHGKCICASFCKKVRTRADVYDPYLLYLSFLHGYTSGEIETYQVQSTGVSNLKWAAYMTTTTRVVPQPAVRARFRTIVEAWFAEMDNLGKQAACARKSRDLLLPRLLSGELAVEEVR